MIAAYSGTQGGIASQCCPLQVIAPYGIGGIAAILSQIVVEWVAKALLGPISARFGASLQTCFSSLHPHTTSTQKPPWRWPSENGPASKRTTHGDTVERVGGPIHLAP